MCGASRQEEKPEVEEVTTTIFYPPEIPVQDDQGEEQMPQKGNVLDKVVQFTALQVFTSPITFVGNTSKKLDRFKIKKKISPIVKLSSILILLQ